MTTLEIRNKRGLFSAILFMIALGMMAQVRITRVDPASDEITIRNFGSSDVDISNYRLCALFSYTSNLTSVTIDDGDLLLSQDEEVRLSGWALNDAASDLGLYLETGSFSSDAAMVDFVQWGSGGNGRESVAASKGIWTAGEFIEAGTSFSYQGDGTTFGVDEFETGLVAHYIFDGEALDQSGNGNHGTENGGLTYTTDRFGNASSAASFDGVDDYIEIDANDAFTSASGGLSINVWINPNDLVTPNSDGIVTKYNTPGNQFSFVFDQADAQVRFLVYNNNGTARGGITNANVLTASTWKMVTGTFDYQTQDVKIFVDGVEYAITYQETSTITAIGTNATPVRIGNYFANSIMSNSDPFDGRIDNVRFYNRALSTSDISDLYNSEKNDLIAHYTFDGDAQDQSGNGNHGIWANDEVYAADRFGNANGAASFDGVDDHVNIGLNVKPSTEMTFSGWMKTSATGIFQTIINARVNGTTEQGYVATVNPSGYFEVALALDGAGWDVIIQSDNVVNDGVWHHLSYSFDGTNTVLYVDGVAQTATSSVAGVISYDGSVGYIGYSGGGYVVSGELDDIRIYNRALSASEIADLYTSESGPIAHYTFDGDAQDQSGNGNHGTQSGGVDFTATDRFGNANSAANFDGTDDLIDLPFSHTQLGDNFTVSAWVYRTKESSSTINQGIVSSDINGNRGFMFGIVGGLGDPGENDVVASFSNGTTFHATWTDPSSAFEWIMYTATYDGSTLSIYEDGILINSTAATGTPPGTANFQIGHDQFDALAGRYFGGLLDDIRVYNRALSASEIAELYTSESGLIAHYTFDGDALDQSGNGNHGTEYGGVAYTTDRFGNASGAASFDGVDDFVDIPNPYENDVFTVKAWVKIDPSDLGTGNTVLEGWKDGEFMRLGYGYYDLTEAQSFSGYDGAGFYARGSAHVWQDNTNLYQEQHLFEPISANNDWKMLTISYEFPLISSYLDGFLVEQVNVSGLPTAPSGSTKSTYISGIDFLIGLNKDNEYYKGAIDDLELYNRALSASEIADLYTEESGLIAHYTFDGDALDQSGNGNHGTENGGVAYTTDRFGNASGAASFDGVDDYIDLTNEDVFDINSNYTVSSWINTNTQNGTNEAQVIFNVGGYQSGGKWKTFNLHIPEQNYYALEVEGENADTRSHAITNETTTLNEWKHVLTTWNHSTATARIYIGGEENTYLSQIFTSSGPVEGNTRALIGASYRSSLEHVFHGAIDDVKIWNRELSATEIADLYTSESGLIAHYTFDGDAQDQSGNGNHGTWNNDEVYGTDRFGNTTGAASFDGVDDYVNVPHNDALTMSNQFTLSSWVLSTDQTTQQEIVTKGTAASHQYAMYLTNISNELRSSVGVSTNNTGSLVSQSTSDWIHALTIYDGSDLITYKNGEEIGRLTIDFSTVSSNTSDLLIGYGGATAYLNGKLDDIRIYNRAFSASEIADLYTEESGLVAHYTFDGDAQDQSGNGNHGTEYGGLTYTTDRFGNPNSATSFDGVDDRVVVSNNELFNNNVQITLSAWVWSENGIDEQGILYKGASADHQYGIVRQNSEFIMNAWQSGGAGHLTALSQSGASIGEWQHVVGTINQGDYSRIYINGQLMAEDTTPDGSWNLSSSGDLHIGSHLSSFFFQGALDDIRIYNRALSSSEISELYTEGGWPTSGNTPVITASQSFNVLEDAANTTSVGSVLATDADANTTFSNWLITSGNTDGIFSINASSGEITVSDNSNLDFETTESYTLTLTVSDGENTSLPETVTIDVTDVNDNIPVITPSQVFSVSEDADNTTSVGTVLATDADANTTLSNWTITAGNDDGVFTINQSSGEITVSDNSNINYQTTQSYTLTVSVSDGTNTSQLEDVTINVSDVNDNTPVITPAQSFNVDETATNTTSVGTVAATDADAVTTYTNWTITAGNEEGVFAIHASSGEISILDNSNLDFETTESFILTLTVSDGVNTSQPETITIQVIDENDELPIIATAQTFELSETAANTTNVGTVIATDADANTIFSNWVILSGNGDGIFQIGASSGEITVEDNSNLDFETSESYTLTLTVSDGDNISAEQTVIIDITDENDNNPVITASQSFNVSEDASNTTSVGTVTATDLDAGTSFSSWSILSGNNQGVFVVDPTSGDITVTNNSNLDFETTQEYVLTLTVTDGVNTSAEETVTINVIDVNDNAPVITPAQSFSVAENASNLAIIGTAIAEDVDTQTTLQNWTINAGNDDNIFVINSSSGELSIGSSDNLDYETTQEYTLTLTVSDGVNTSTPQTIQIDITDANDAPEDITLSDSEVPENQSLNTVVGTFTAVDDDLPEDTHTYQLTNGEAENDLFTLTSSGELKTNQIFDYEHGDGNSFDIVVRVEDGSGAGFEKGFTITVTDENDAPTSISLDNHEIAENGSIGDVVGALTTEDQDLGDTFSYSMATGAGDDDNASFDFQGGNLIANEAFDFETVAEYSIRIKSTDAAGADAEAVMIIAVTDNNDSPTSLSLSPSTIDENENLGVTVGALSTEDQDGSDVHAYSIKAGFGDDLFEVQGTDLVTKQSFDHESEDTHVVTIITDDQNGGTHEKELNIDIKDVNESPDQILISNNHIFSYQGNGAEVGVLSVSDPDEGDSHVYALVQGVQDNDDFSISGSKIVTSDSLAVGSYTVEVTAIDNGGLSFIKTFVITVTNDQPEEVLEFGNDRTSYRIITAPTPSVKVSVFFNAFLDRTQGKDWEVYDFVESSQQVSQMSKQSNMIEGQGYWFLAREQGSPNLPGNAGPVDLNSNGEFEINLLAGWNLIGNPFRETLNWSNEINGNPSNLGTLVSSQVDVYEGAYNKTGTLDPFEGAYVFADAATTIYLRHPSSEVTARSDESARFISGSDGWEIEVIMTNGKQTSNIGGFGMNSEASVGVDYLDYRVPPALSDDIQFRWDDGQGLGRNIVSKREEFTWEYQIKTNRNRVTLTWDNQLVNALGESVWIELLPQKKVVDMNRRSTITYQPQPNQSIKIYYGNIPESLLEVYPNPASENVTLRLKTLGSEVKLSVFNLQGQAIYNDHINSDQNEIFEWTWDLRGTNGRSVPAGMYLLKINREGRNEEMLKLVVK